MTDQEKMLIKKELYNAYCELPTHSDPNTKFVIAVKFGLERAQRQINENRKE